MLQGGHYFMVGKPKRKHKIYKEKEKNRLSFY